MQDKYFIKTVILFSFLLHAWNMQAQEKEHSYWQQQLEYFIHVELNESDKSFNAKQILEYKNNSPDTLRELYIHVYPNAYSDKNTPFAKQLLENGNMNFAKAERMEMGKIKDIEFQEIPALKDKNDIFSQNLKGKKLQWEFQDAIDIIKIDFQENPILPGQKRYIYTPFKVEIPHVFSRMGYADNIFHISQWYPKPAVYDKKGWHPMTYLDQGEFYGEFANYYVEIDLPSHYTVLATGEMDSKEKRNLLKEENQKLRTNSRKTVSFTAKNVHDFAWFASNRWAIAYEEWQKPSGKYVELWAASLQGQEWNKLAIETMKKTVVTLEKEVGVYPYPQITAVEGALSAGGGMEYPMITIIQKDFKGKILEQVIAHEVGHNWFYGVLASNERDFPWMDESINSFYEQKITNDSKTGDISNQFIKLGEQAIISENSRSGYSQALHLGSEEYTNANYGVDLYLRGPVMLKYLESFLGEESFRTMMRAYYSEWAMKHPQWEDLKNTWQKNTSKNIQWFFQWLEQEELGDLSIHKKKKNTYLIKNNTGIPRFPVPLVSAEQDKEITTWLQFDGKDTLVELPNNKAKNVSIATNWDDKPINNNARKKIGIGILGGIGQNDKEKIYLSPVLGGNAHDGFMLGLGMHNITLPLKDFQIAFAPMYGFASKSLVGSGDMRYRLKKVAPFIQSVTLGGQVHSYHYDSKEYETAVFTKRFLKINPYVNIVFKKNHPRSPWNHRLNFNVNFISEEDYDYIYDEIRNQFLPQESFYSQNNFASLKYRLDYEHYLMPFSLTVQTKGNHKLVQASIEFQSELSYFMKKEKARFRFFGGYMGYDSHHLAYLPLQYHWATTHNSTFDYTYDDLYFARNERLSFIQNQVNIRHGGFKLPTTFYSRPIGVSDSWILATNFTFDIPKIIIPLRVYADFAVLPEYKYSGSDKKIQSLYNIGLELYAGNLLSVYFPILIDAEHRDYVEYILGGKYGRTITFKFDIHALNLQSWRKLLF